MVSGAGRRAKASRRSGTGARQFSKLKVCHPLSKHEQQVVFFCAYYYQIWCSFVGCLLKIFSFSYGKIKEI